MFRCTLVAKDEQKTAKGDFRLNELVYRPHFAGCTQTLLQHTWSLLRQLALTSMPIVSLTWHLFLGCCKTLACFTMFYHVFAWCGKFQVCWIFVIGTLVIPDSWRLKCKKTKNEMFSLGKTSHLSLQPKMLYQATAYTNFKCIHQYYIVI